MSAIISDCGLYRYALNRNFGSGNGSVIFVMLNPSTADATLGDPTIRRCVGFAKRMNALQLVVANLYALRATDPKELWSAEDPVGPENDELLTHILRQHRTAICAWGANARPDRVQKFLAIAKDVDAALWCPGTTKSGAPRHPLYIKGDQPLVPYIHGVIA